MTRWQAWVLGLILLNLALLVGVAREAHGPITWQPPTPVERWVADRDEGGAGVPGMRGKRRTLGKSKGGKGGKGGKGPPPGGEKRPTTSSD